MASSALPSNARLVDIGTHSLALYTHGPKPRSPQDPVVLFISGVASDALVWQAVVRLLSSASLRSYTYDRSGYSNSETSPLEPSAENVAKELGLLIEKGLGPNPLILVGHSWAGVLIHEFIALRGTDRIAGLVLVDTNHETMPFVLDIRDPKLWLIAEGVDAWAAKGITTEHKLTKEEWDTFLAAEKTEKFEQIQQKEAFEQYSPSFETLRRKGQSEKQPLVGDRPVCVIGSTRSRDWKGFYEAGVARGNGTEEERSYVREFIRTVDGRSESLMKEFLKLSTKSHLVFATESGHFIQLTQPDLVVDGVKWVLDNLPTSS